MSGKSKKFEWPDGLTLKIPDGLDLGDQLAFCIGNLVMAWANCESMFYGIFACVVGKAGTDNAAILWLGTKSTKARVDMTLQLIANLEIADGLKAEIARLAKAFDGVTRTRNFFCHAFYRIDTASMKLAEAEAFTFDRSLNTYKSKKKRITKATINELSDAIKQTVVLNHELWSPLLILREQLKADHIPLPEPFPELLRPGDISDLK